MNASSFEGTIFSFTPTQITIVLTDWVLAYSVYLFLSGFFSVKQRKNKVIEIISYQLFWIVGSVQYLYCNTIFANILFNLIATFLLTLNYEGKLQFRIIAPLMIYITSSIVEVVTAGFNVSAYFFKSPEGTIPIVSVLEDRVLILMLSALVSKLKNIRDGEKIPGIYWAAFIALPVITFVFILIFITVPISYLQFMLCTSLILLLDVLIYFVFDRMLYLQQKNRKALMFDLQNESYRQQLEIMNEALKNTKLIRHDIKNQMLVIQGLLEKKDIDGALTHLQTMTHEWSSSRQTINTGNIEIDSLINFKLAQAEQQHIHATTNISIPEHIALRPFDTATIIGNLFDNALDALSHVDEDKRTLTITLRYSKGRLFIVFTNQFEGELAWDNDLPQTNKTDTTHHGIGLSDIKKTAEKYNGQLTITAKNGKFTSTVMMYV